MILLTGGISIATVNGNNFTLTPGSLLMTPMDLPYSLRTPASPGYHEGYWIEYTGSWARDLWRQNGLIGHYHIIDDGSLRLTIEDIIDSFRTRRDKAGPEASALLAVVFARSGTCLRKETIRKDLASAAITRAHSFMDTHMADNIGLAEIASAAALSKYHFLRIFRERTGLTPSSYLKNLRIARAQELFRATDMNVTEVANQTGFSTVQHFSRVFKAAIGISPGQYKQAVRPH